MPNKERIKLWVEALRSGEYEQCRQVLRTTRQGKYQYCCLGVATEIAVRNGVVIDQVVWNYADMNDAVATWFGLATNPGLAIPLLPTDSLSDDEGNLLGDTPTATWANDVVKMSFTEIADAIERTYLTEETLDA